MLNRLPAFLRIKPQSPSRFWLVSTLAMLGAACSPGDPGSAAHDSVPAAAAPGEPHDGAQQFDHSIVARSGVEPASTLAGDSVAAYEEAR